MSTDHYRISNSQNAAEKLRAILAELLNQGRREEARRAIRWICEELERTPSEFGESREGSDRTRLHMRITFAEPLFVKFGVHELGRTVFVSHFGFSKRPRSGSESIE